MKQHRAYVLGLMAVLCLLSLGLLVVALSHGRPRSASANTTSHLSSRPAAPAGATATPCGVCLAASTGATIVTATTFLTGSQCDDCAFVMSLPFPVHIGSSTFITGEISSNGHLDFDGKVFSEINACLPSTDVTAAIFAHWDDLDMRVSECGADCGIYTSVSGSAPNRIFDIEWRASLYVLRFQPVHFEIRLYEAQPRFEIIYGEITGDGGAATVGYQLSPTDFCQFSCDTASLFQGLMLAPGLPCNTSTPTGTQTPVPTNTRTSTRTNTPVLTSTSTHTRTATGTSTQTPLPTNTRTATGTPCAGCLTSTPTITPTPCPMNFTDVQPTDWFYEYVRCLYCRGAISGYSDGTFRPNALTTRGQLCKIVVLAYNLPIYTPPTPTFQDVPANHTFYQYIETAYHNGLLTGYNCGAGCLEFRPGANVTRAQLSKIVVNAAGWPIIDPAAPTFRDVPRGDTFYTFIETAYCHQIIAGYDCGTGCLEFRASANATRAQIAKIVCLAVRNEGVCNPP